MPVQPGFTTDRDETQRVEPREWNELLFMGRAHRATTRFEPLTEMKRAAASAVNCLQRPGNLAALNDAFNASEISQYITYARESRVVKPSSNPAGPQACLPSFTPLTQRVFTSLES